MRRIVLAAFALTVLSACEPAGDPLDDEDLAAVRSLEASYVQAVAAGDADAVVALYTEHAVEMPPNMPAREGRANLRSGYGTDAGVTQEFTMTASEIDGRGGLAFDRGTYSWTGMPPGMTEPMTETGKYLAIAREQEDDAWLWAVIIWNSDTPLPQPE
jgi:ketosteroid isomerase-like protein